MRNFKARCVRANASDSLWEIECTIKMAQLSLLHSDDKKFIYDALEAALYKCKIAQRDLYRTPILK